MKTHNLINFEADIDGLGGGDIVPPAGDATPPADPPAAAPWSPPQEQWEQVLATIGTLAQSVQQPPAQETPQAMPLDVLSETFEQDLEAYVQVLLDQRLQESLGKYTPALESAAAQDAERWAEQQYTTVKGELGKDFNKELAIAIATGMVDDRTPPEAAFKAAAQRLVPYIQSERAAAVEEYKQHLASLSGAPTSPGGGITQGAHVAAPAGDELAAAMRFLERQRAL